MYPNEENCIRELSENITKLRNINDALCLSIADSSEEIIKNIESAVEYRIFYNNLGMHRMFDERLCYDME
jgi:hypothetical protein